MKSRKSPKEIELKQLVETAVRALRMHFTGDGARARTIAFLKSIGSPFLCCLTVTLSFSMLVSGHFMKALHSRMLQIPIEEIVDICDSVIRSTVWECIPYCLIISFAWRVGDITRPACLKAAQRFRDECALHPEESKKA